jgi:hypothetical protein
VIHWIEGKDERGKKEEEIVSLRPEAARIGSLKSIEKWQ